MGKSKSKSKVAAPNMVMYQVRLPPSYRAKLVKVARSERVPASDLVRAILVGNHKPVRP